MKFAECKGCGWEVEVDDNNWCNDCKEKGLDKQEIKQDLNITYSRDSNEQDFQNTNLKEGEVKYGRLHFVNSTRVLVSCRICKLDIMPKSKAYNQSYQDSNTFFPTQTKVCFSCGQNLIKQGTILAEK